MTRKLTFQQRSSLHFEAREFSSELPTVSHYFHILNDFFKYILDFYHSEYSREHLEIVRLVIGIFLRCFSAPQTQVERVRSKAHLPLTNTRLKTSLVCKYMRKPVLCGEACRTVTSYTVAAALSSSEPTQYGTPVLMNYVHGTGVATLFKH